MISLIIQTVLLVAIAFILGCVAGCLLRSLLGSAETNAPSSAAGTGAIAAGTTATAAPAADAKAKVAVAPRTVAPAVPRPPQPAAPIEPAAPAKIETPVAPPVSKPSKSTSKSKAAPKQKKPAADAASTPDNLKLIRGIGPQNEARLNELGVNSFSQIASWSRKDQAHFGEVLAFPGRIEREDWVGQAKKFAKGSPAASSGRASRAKIERSADASGVSGSAERPANLLEKPKGGEADKLTLIDGVGNALEQKLNRLGVFYFEQIAALSTDELNWLGNELGFPGRPARENWAGAAKNLAKGGGAQLSKRTQRGQIKSRSKS